MESEIKLAANGNISVYAGLDAVNLFRAKVLCQGINMYIETKGRLIPTRGMTLTRMLAMVTGYTGKPYKRSEAGRAMADLRAWIITMEAGIPVVDHEGKSV